jgi:Ni/Co efflux regulator RcnB
MRALGILAGAAIVALAPAAAFAADTGATAGVPMQTGSAWGHGTVAAAPMMPAQAYAPAPGAGWQGAAPQWHDHGDYHRPVRGWKVPKHYRDGHYAVADWRGWGFGQPGPGMSWIRYYDDALLIDADGRVVDSRMGVNWDGGYRGGAYAGGAYPAGPAYGYPGAYPPPPGYVGGVMPGTTSYRAGPNTMVTTTVTPVMPPVAYAAGYGGGAVVTVTPGMAVTTTTTTTDYETVYRNVAVRKRVWRRPIRRYHPRCVQNTCPVQGS